MNRVSVQDRIAKLTSLLDRIQHNSAQPRPQRVVAPTVAQAAAPVAQPARPSTVPPASADLVEEVELLDDDLVEIQTVPPEAASEPPPAVEAPPAPAVPEVPAAKQPDFGLDFEEEEEEPPASSRRPIAASMDQALADAAEREVPLKTPPPESGPQEASIPPSPELDSLLDPGAAEARSVGEGLPTSAQLGNTVALDEGEPADLEVAHVPSDQPGAGAPEVHEDEADIPQREAVGTYDSNLAPPPEARNDLQRHSDAEARRAINEELADVPQIPKSSPPPAGAENVPELIERPRVHVRGVTSIVGAAQRFQPKTFVELLDASLKLGG